MQEKGGDFTFRGSWRATYLAATGLCPAAQQRQQQPLQVQGFYSDLLYQPHFCASTPLRPEWLARDTLPRRAGLDAEAFRRLYELPNQPVVLTDAVRTCSLSCYLCFMHACMHAPPAYACALMADSIPCMQGCCIVHKECTDDETRL